MKFKKYKNIGSTENIILLMALILSPIIYLLYIVGGGVIDLTLDCIIIPVYLWGIYFLLHNNYTFEIYEDIIYFKNIFGKEETHFNKDIHYCKIPHQRQDKNVFKILIYLNKRTISFYEDTYEDFRLLNEHCQKNYKKLAKKTIKIQECIVPTFCGLISIIGFCFTLSMYRKQNIANENSIKKEGYVKLKGIVKSYETRGKRNDIMYVKLKDYSTPFEILGFNDNKSYYYGKIERGNVVVFHISPYHYTKRVIQSIPEEFHEKYFRYGGVSVYKVE